jgi:hypothetical protein
MSGATWTDLRGGPRVGDLMADPVDPIELESDWCSATVPVSRSIRLAQYRS